MALLRERDGFGVGFANVKRWSKLNRRGIATTEAVYLPSDFSTTSRLSSWCASAVQLREVLFSTADRRAEFSGSAPSTL
jgi:hypothetical protein